MPENVVTVAPDSTGKSLRTRSRTQPGGTATVHEQVVIPVGMRVVAAAATVTTSRVPVRAATSQVLFTLYNTSAAVLYAVRRLAVEADNVTAVTAFSQMRSYRISAAPAGGTNAAFTTTDSTALSSPGIAALGDASADGTNSATALTATVSGTGAWVQQVPRMVTASGWSTLIPLSMLPDDGSWTADNPLILRQNQGIAVRFETSAAPTAGAFQFIAKAAVEEFTYP